MLCDEPVALIVSYKKQPVVQCCGGYAPAFRAYERIEAKAVYKIQPYELYFYGGALMNVFVMWEKNGKQETPEAIAKTLASGAADTFPASCDGNR